MRRPVPPVVALDVPLSAPDEPVSFRNEVMAVLSQARCKLGAFHGTGSGKSGFRLSLVGPDPGIGYRQLTRRIHARRVAGRSLAASPHEHDAAVAIVRIETRREPALRGCRMLQGRSL